MFSFVFRQHLRLAIDAAILFVVGLFVSWPVVYYRVRTIARPPIAVFRFVLRLIGPAPSLPRLTAVVFCFNAGVIFVYMASGFHPLLPKVFAIWTGMNIGIVIGLGHEEGLAEPSPPPAGQWRPSLRLAAGCGLLVLLLELPAFWLSIAMGLTMGHAVQIGGATYAGALAERTAAYATVILPMLLASAVAEAVAIRGAAAPYGGGEGED